MFANISHLQCRPCAVGEGRFDQQEAQHLAANFRADFGITEFPLTADLPSLPFLLYIPPLLGLITSLKQYVCVSSVSYSSKNQIIN